MKTRRYIAYFRVSTPRQGRSGLGLEAQQQAVNVFLHGQGELVLESYTEIESGRKNDRPQLAVALDACRRHKAALLIAKLDRLARNVHFISGLMESGVEFIAVDIWQGWNGFTDLFHTFIILRRNPAQKSLFSGAKP